MIVDKVIFSVTEQFSVCWNLNSQIYRTKLDIEPICLLFGKKTSALSEQYGRIIEIDTEPRYPLLPQLMWSKFYFVTGEVNTTWMIGDIDLMPLQTSWFTENLKSISDTEYVHLDADAITQQSLSPYTWCGRGELHAGNMPAQASHQTNLPGYYHAAKGCTFKAIRAQPTTLLQEIDHIVNSGQYNNARSWRDSDPIDQANLWCAEEKRSTEMIREAIVNKRIHFTGFSVLHGIHRSTGKRVDRSTLKDEATNRQVSNDYAYDTERLKIGDYIDIHCARPFQTFMPQTTNVLRLAGMIE